MLDRVTGSPSGPLGAYGCHPGAPSGSSTCRRTRPTWSTTRTTGRRCCGCTGSATTPRPRSPPSWPGWTRCGPRPGSAPRGCCPARGGGRGPARRSAERPAGRPGAAICVRFEFLPGTEPPDDDAAHFAELGEITARMHRHARHWARPAGFTRFRWDYDAAFGARPAGAAGRTGSGSARPSGRSWAGSTASSRPAGRVRHRAGAVRAGARRHPAGQPARRRRPGQRHRLRRLRLRLVPLRPRHGGELLRAPAARAGR